MASSLRWGSGDCVVQARVVFTDWISVYNKALYFVSDRNNVSGFHTIEPQHEWMWRSAINLWWVASGRMCEGSSCLEQRVLILNCCRLLSWKAELPQNGAAWDMDVQDVPKLTSVSVDELAASVDTISQKIISLRGFIPFGSKKSSRHLTFNNHLVSWWKHAAANWSPSLGT